MWIREWMLMICTDKLNGKKEVEKTTTTKQTNRPTIMEDWSKRKSEWVWSWFCWTRCRFLLCGLPSHGPKERVNEFDHGSVGLGAGSCYVGCQVISVPEAAGGLHHWPAVSPGVLQGTCSSLTHQWGHLHYHMDLPPQLPSPRLCFCPPPPLPHSLALEYA